MKKILYMLLFFQSGLMMAQTETLLTVNGKKVLFNPSGMLNSADNGLTATGNNIQLGGALTKASVLTTTSAFTLAIKGLQTGALTDQLVTADANGVLRAIPNNYWSTNGNAGTVPGTNFLGTTDDVDVVFKRNNVNFGRFRTKNISMGPQSMENITTGINNSAYGYQSLKVNSTGDSNTAVGYSSLLSNTSGDSNTAIGSNALIYNVSGSGNTAVGIGALGAMKSGSNNVAVGNAALSTATQGDANIAIGRNSGSYLVGNLSKPILNSSMCIYIGEQTTSPIDNVVNQIVIGTGGVGQGSNTVQIGNVAMTKIGGAVDWSIPSDVRLKKDIVSSTHGLDFISKLRPVTYHMKTGNTDLQSGFIAQEVETAAKAVNYEFNGLVKPASENDFYSLRYSEFVVPLVKAVQEEQQMIESQKADIAELKAQVQALLKAAK